MNQRSVKGSPLDAGLRKIRLMTQSTLPAAASRVEHREAQSGVRVGSAELIYHASTTNEAVE